MTAARPVEPLAPATSVGTARLAAAAALAREHGIELTPQEVVDLLGPEIGAIDLSGVVRAATPSSGVSPIPGESPESRRSRGIRFRAEGEDVAATVLRPVARLLRCLGITGSTAYGTPVADDDLDFLAVVRRGAVWPFLLFVWSAARWKRRESQDGPRAWCFNLVLDELEARREFSRPRGFLVAREALMLQPLRGEEYYRALIASAPWIRGEVPGLYDRWVAGPSEEMGEDRPAPWPVRAANVALYPWMATYLQLMALLESARYRKEGAPARVFRVSTTLGKVGVYTERFNELDRLWRGAAFGPGGTAR